MRIAIIGRSEVLHATASRLVAEGHEIVLVVTAKEAPEYTKTTEDFKLLAEENAAIYSHTPRIIEAINLIKCVSPIDVGISFNYPGIIPQHVIGLFRLGILNAHGGDLPRYRGNACQAWAILNGEEEIGLCIHKMIGDELDSGDIINRSYFTIDHTTKIGACWAWLHKRVPELFVDALDTLSKDSEFILEQQSKNPQDALRCFPRNSEDGRIDWRKNAVQILRLINASNKPYAGAFCGFDNKKLIIWDAELLTDIEPYLAVAGQILNIAEGYVDVACGQGAVRISHIEFEGIAGSPDKLIKSIRKRLT